MGRLALKILTLIRWLLSPESLATCPAKLPRARCSPGVTRWLLQQNPLPLGLDQGGMANRQAVHSSPGFLYGILAPENLPDIPGLAPAPAQHLTGIWRWVFGAEELSLADTSEEPSASPPGMLRRLVSSEPCPQNQPAELRRRQSLAGQLLFCQAALPVSVGRPKRGPGFIGWLAARETLPDCGPIQRPPASGFLRWLLSSEAH